MKCFIVAHDFHAEEDVELSVNKGEVLCATEGVAQDGWMKVEVITDARRRGFVPTSYLSELTAAEATAVLQAHGVADTAHGMQPSSTSPNHTPQRQERDRSPNAGTTHNTTASTSLDLGSRSAIAVNAHSSSGLAAHSPSPRAAHNTTVRSPDAAPPISAIAPTNTPRSTAATATAAAPRATTLTPAQQASGPVNRNLLENPNAVVDAFMKNEVYFKQLMQRRASALAQMQAGIEEAMTEVAACKDRNTVLTRKLRDLDDVVERERGRWMQRVEEEKAHVSRSGPYSAQLAVPVSSGTTPVRSPVSGQRGGPGRSVLEEHTSRQLRA